MGAAHWLEEFSQGEAGEDHLEEAAGAGGWEEGPGDVQLVPLEVSKIVLEGLADVWMTAAQRMSLMSRRRIASHLRRGRVEGSKGRYRKPEALWRCYLRMWWCVNTGKRTWAEENRRTIEQGTAMLTKEKSR